MLVTLKEILTHAREHHYAVPAFDVVEDVMVRAVLEQCEALRAPAILMCLPGPDLEGHGWSYIAGLVKAVADCHDIPIALHLDHATDMDQIQRALDEGFTSVMIDGSHHPFAANVAITRSVVEWAHPLRVSVEAELGFVGGADLDETQHTESVLTDPDEVVQFIDQTAVDALAVSIGTAHGVYKSTPNLNIERLQQLNQVSTVPLVLHGGSGTPDDQIRAAAAHGICKLNVYADNRVAAARGLQACAAAMTRPDPLPKQLFGPIKAEIQQVVEAKIRLLSAQNRA